MMHNGIFRISTMQRLKHASRYIKLSNNRFHETTPLATYHKEKVSRKQIARDVRSGIICYLMVLVGLTISSMMVYGVFFS